MEVIISSSSATWRGHTIRFLSLGMDKRVVPQLWQFPPVSAPPRNNRRARATKRAEETAISCPSEDSPRWWPKTKTWSTAELQPSPHLIPASCAVMKLNTVAIQARKVQPLGVLWGCWQIREGGTLKHARAAFVLPRDKFAFKLHLLVTHLGFPLCFIPSKRRGILQNAYLKYITNGFSLQWSVRRFRQHIPLPIPPPSSGLSHCH